MRITSLQNPRVKEAVRLRDRKGREQQQRLIIDGRREIRCALATGFSILEVFLHPATSEDPEGARLSRELALTGAACWEVSADVFRKLSFGNRDEGFIAIAQPRHESLDQFAPPTPPLVVILDGVEKPGNIGAVLRTADAAGASALFVTNPGTDLFNPNIVRASLGAVFTIPLVVARPAEVLAWLERQGITPFAARVDGATPYFEHDFRGPVAFVLGSEAAGLGSPWKDSRLVSIQLPMQGRVDSLNVSNTAAVLLYETVRQRVGRSLRADTVRRLS
jgi:RNA methyltransferase, TrmH family